MRMRPSKADTAVHGCLCLGSLLIFSGRFRGNARYQRGHNALFSGYSLPKHNCVVFTLRHIQQALHLHRLLSEQSNRKQLNMLNGKQREF